MNLYGLSEAEQLQLALERSLQDQRCPLSSNLLSGPSGASFVDDGASSSGSAGRERKRKSEDRGEDGPAVKRRAEGVDEGGDGRAGLGAVESESGVDSGVDSGYESGGVWETYDSRLWDAQKGDGAASGGAGGSSRVRVSYSDGTIRFPQGRLFLTRTPGRINNPNATRLEELVELEHLKKAFFCFFYRDNDYWFHELRFGHNENGRKVEIIISGDIKHDQLFYRNTAVGQYLREEAFTKDPANPSAKLRKPNQAEMLVAAEELRILYKATYGENYEMVYPYSGALVHSKIGVVQFDKFIRVIVTSANAHAGDLEAGSNHFYVQDFPLLPSSTRSTPNSFSSYLYDHLIALECPKSFAKEITRSYDFSRAAVELVTSHPNTQRLDGDFKYGLFRVGELSRMALDQVGEEWKKSEEGKLGLPLPRSEIEVCTASVGSLEGKEELWIAQAAHYFSGEKLDEPPRDGSAPRYWERELKVVFPTQAYGDQCSEEAKKCAPGTATHLGALWEDVSTSVKGLFHQYIDKDLGLITHQKTYLHVQREGSRPNWLMLGSHNFSQAALGTISWTLRDGIRLKGGNYECSIFVPGSSIASLLADESSWHDIVSYERPTMPYATGKGGDWPFSSGAWGTKAGEEKRVEEGGKEKQGKMEEKGGDGEKKTRWVNAVEIEDDEEDVGFVPTGEKLVFRR